MKSIVTAVIIVLIISLIPISAFANKLPDFELPDQEPLETPSLSKDYNKAVDTLREQGFGSFEHGKDGKIPLPEASGNENKEKTGNQKFEEEHGNMKNSPDRQLKKESIIPKDEYFDEVRDSHEKKKEGFYKIRDINNKQMSELMKKKLDKSFLYDLEAIKKIFDSRFLTDKQLKGFLAATPKPGGWDETVRISYITPTLTLNRLAPPEYQPPIIMAPPSSWASQPATQTATQPATQAATQTATQTSASTAGVPVRVPSSAPFGEKDPAKNPYRSPAAAPVYGPARETAWDKTKGGLETAWNWTKGAAKTVGSTVSKGATAVGNWTKNTAAPVVSYAKEHPVKTGAIVLGTAGAVALGIFAWPTLAATIPTIGAAATQFVQEAMNTVSQVPSFGF